MLAGSSLGRAATTGWAQHLPPGCKIIPGRLLGTGRPGARGTSGAAGPRLPVPGLGLGGGCCTTTRWHAGSKAARISPRVQKLRCKLISSSRWEVWIAIPFDWRMGSSR